MPKMSYITLYKSWYSYQLKFTKHSYETKQVNCLSNVKNRIEIDPSVWKLQCHRQTHIHTDIEVNFITFLFTSEVKNMKQQKYE